MHEGPNPRLDLPPAPAFDQTEYVRRLTNAQKRLTLYPVRVRKIKRLRKQIKDLTKALNREKDYSVRLGWKLREIHALEWKVRDLKDDNFMRYLAGVTIGAVIGFMLFAQRLP